MKHIKLPLLFAIILFPVVSYGATATVQKGLIGEQDLNHYTGTGSPTFTRPSSTGGTLTLNKVGYEVDALISYGGGTSYTKATLDAAYAAASPGNTILVRPGTWAMDANADYSGKAITWKIVPGAVISYGAYTLTIPNLIDPGPVQVFSGTGNVYLTAIDGVRPEWWGASNKDSSDAAVQTATLDAIRSALASSPIIDSGTKCVARVIFTEGVYPVKTTTAKSIELLYTGMSMEGAAPARKWGRSMIKNYATDGSHTIRIGNLVELTPDTNHRYDISLKNLWIRGTADAGGVNGDGIRVWQASVKFEGVYSTHNTLRGIYLWSAYASSFYDVECQSNYGGAQWNLTGELTQVAFYHCSALSPPVKAGSYGWYISGGAGTSSSALAWHNCDTEGFGTGMWWATDIASIQNVVIDNCDFENNTKDIDQAAAGFLDSLVFLSYRGSGGVYFKTLRDSTIIAPRVQDVAFEVSNPTSVIMLNPSLGGTGSITGAQVIETNAGTPTEAFPNGSMVLTSTLRGAWHRINGAWVPTQLISRSTTTISAGSGAVVQAINVEYANYAHLLMTQNGITGLTVNFTNANPVSGEMLRFTFSNTSTSSGAVTFQNAGGATVFTTAAFNIPTQNKFSSITFVYESGIGFIEISRAVDAS